jgi:integrase
MGQDLVRIDPVAGIQPPIKNLAPRDRFLTCNEVVSIWFSLDQAAITPGLRIALRLSLVTAQRIGEIAATAKRDIDLDSDMPVLVLPRPHTKNKKPHRVPLSPLAVQLIREATALSGDSVYLFPSPVREGPLTSHSGTRAIGRLRPKLDVEDFRLHDLRKAAADGMKKLRINPFTISLVLNHGSVRQGTVTMKHYIDEYSFDDEKAEALYKWGGKLQEILSIYCSSGTQIEMTRPLVKHRPIDRGTGDSVAYQATAISPDCV